MKLRAPKNPLAGLPREVGVLVVVAFLVALALLFNRRARLEGDILRAKPVGGPLGQRRLGRLRAANHRSRCQNTHRQHQPPPRLRDPGADAWKGWVSYGDGSARKALRSKTLRATHQKICGLQPDVNRHMASAENRMHPHCKELATAITFKRADDGAVSMQPSQPHRIMAMRTLGTIWPHLMLDRKSVV